MGFNFTKISIERFKDTLKKEEELKISTQIDISEIKEVKSNILKTKEEILMVTFSHKVNYDPGVAEINLEGKVIIALPQKIVKEVLKQWKKKKMPEEFRIPLFNIILKKSSLKALALEEELNLPLHIPLPSFKREEK